MRFMFIKYIYIYIYVCIFENNIPKNISLHNPWKFIDNALFAGKSKCV